ncbi:MAG: pentapeptide repeat-containing protein [Anaerolineae bacterium]|jgi:uncharacterized protein YjbI with pentapeptide repeats|nr:pentapeptide repeat-containing protein [Anaerolineae bacterium]MBT3714772.1 pentapeptide repeat-containing protein [Anaerolineae bacterium]MBT4311148.1 pentapeptide repeat-containing protein [Anaerolineae bacterium]MBT4457596.1 pentapeptide repeat-containing protein [Anaerolineae bacterium]MBT4841763.1 pentapeptide repeat-containing protein [Anaerolineae bacterium]
MAIDEHLEILEEGVLAWNTWRENHHAITPDLSGANLREKDLRGINFRRANLRDADLHQADLAKANLHKAVLRDANLYKVNLENANIKQADFRRANMRGVNAQNVIASGAYMKRANLSKINFSGANLTNAQLELAEISGGASFNKANLNYAVLIKANLKDANFIETTLVNANFHEANLAGAHFRGADLTSANLTEADLQGADFTEAHLYEANLSQASIIKTKLEQAYLDRCRVYGCSVWDIRGEPASQKDLLISDKNDGDITTDDVEVAQFIYLMYDNKKIRNIINSVTSKGVLILGRFSPPERKVVLDGLREKLREFNLLPIVFDFDRPVDKDYTETVQTLAGMSLFVIADVTSPKSIPLELEATAKQFKIPFLPILDTSVDEYSFSMLIDLQKNFHWVLKTLEYKSKERLLENIKVAIIDRAIAKHNELRKEKAMETKTLTIDDLLHN